MLIQQGVLFKMELLKTHADNHVLFRSISTAIDNPGCVRPVLFGPRKQTHAGLK